MRGCVIIHRITRNKRNLNRLSRSKSVPLTQRNPMKKIDDFIFPQSAPE